MTRFFIIILLTSHAFVSNSQKKVIDTSVFGKWPSIDDWSTTISHDGKYLSYSIKNDPTGGNSLIIQSTDNKWLRKFPYANRGLIWSESKKFIFKNSGDSLFIGILGSNLGQYISNVKSFQAFPEGRGEWLAYLVTKPLEKLVLLNLKDGQENQFPSAVDYYLNEPGNVLLIQKKDPIDSANLRILQWVDIQTNKVRNIWRGQKAFNFNFDNSNNQLVFSTKEGLDNKENYSIWYYKRGMETAIMRVNNSSQGVDSNLKVSDSRPIFSVNGDRLFFKLEERKPPLPKPDAVQVDVWSYKDRSLQSYQQFYERAPKAYSVVLNLANNQLFRLEHEDELLLIPRNNDEGNDEFMLLKKDKRHDDTDLLYNSSPLSFLLISIKDNSRFSIIDSTPTYPPHYFFEFPGSRNGKWHIYYDVKQKTYVSFEAGSGIKRELTKHIPVSFIDNEAKWYIDTIILLTPVGVAGWLPNDSAVIIYDDYDIWRVDPNAKKPPINITAGFGRKNQIRFRLMNESDISKMGPKQSTLFITAFSLANKFSGFYKVALNGEKKPELLSFGPWQERVITKARDENVWIIQRMSATQAPNYYITTDFKKYEPISNLSPEKEYNWLTSELINWKMLDGQSSQGILYKPENFDLHKKYPIIFHYYQRLSGGLYDYMVPEATDGSINIPWFVSHGYLVFEPDIYYKIGRTGESVMNTVVSAAKFLSKMQFVDSQRMAISGHSFGGFETNYLVTHTDIFAAAASGSGHADLISDYGTISGRAYCDQFMYEFGQYRLGVPLLESPDIYIKNSPIFMVDKVKTPLLIMHNKNDIAVPWVQAIEFFTGLRRLKKRVWLLQYDQGGHALSEPIDALDYTIRLTQFFDHYLKGTPPPLWMTDGIEAKWKGIKTGYELDLTGKKP